MKSRFVGFGLILFLAVAGDGLRAATYTIKVKTSAVEKAAGFGKATLTLIGTKGIHREIFVGGTREIVTKTPIKKVKNGHTTTVIRSTKVRTCHLRQGRVDERVVDCPSVGILQSLHVDYRPRNAREAWHLEHVIVKVVDGRSRRRLLFPCNRWFSKTEGDRKTSRRLLPTSKLVRYELAVHTGSRKRAGTDARVRVDVEGSTGQEIASWQIDNPGNDREAGSVDRYTIYAPDLGRPKRLRLSHDGSGKHSGWYVSKASLTRVSAPKRKWTFRFERWLDGKSGTAAFATPER